MSGRASKELAKELSVGADIEFERVLKALTKAVQEAAVEYRQMSAPKGSPAPKAAKPAEIRIDQTLLNQIRLQTMRAAG